MDILSASTSRNPLSMPFLPAHAEHRQFPNDRAGCAALVRWIGTSAVRVVFEPTGPYHRLFEASLVAAGIEAVKVNPGPRAVSPRQPANWPRPIGSTRRSWRGWARFSIWEGRPAKTETLHDLRELGVARQALVRIASPQPIASRSL